MQMLPAVLTSGSLLSNIAAGVGAVSSIAGGMYQSQVARMNQGIAKQNAARSVQQAAVTAQMQDQEAQVEMGAMQAQGSSSGLALGVGSQALKRRSLEQLAARDRGFTAYAGETEKNAYLQQAAGYASEASAAMTTGVLGAVNSLTELSFPNYVADATTVSPSAARRVRPQPNPYYVGAI